jgi:thiamine transport system permease protein
MVAGGFLAPYISALALAFRDTPPAGWLPLLAGYYREPALRKIIAFTVNQAFFSTLGALAIGIPGAFILADGFGGFGKRVLRSVTAIPFALPSILVVLGFVLFWGNSGWINRGLAALGAPPIRLLYRKEAVILAHSFYNFPLVIRLTGDSLARLRMRYYPPALSLGASPGAAGLTVLFPLLLPSLVSASLLVFLYCFTSFAVVLVLGGGPASSTLGVEIYRYAKLRLDYPHAGALVIAETAIAALVFLLYLFCQKKAAVGDFSAKSPGRNFHIKTNSRPKFMLKTFYLTLAALVVLGPLFAIPLESFLYRASRGAPPVLSLRYWLMMKETLFPAFGRSLALALASASLATAAAIAAAIAARGGLKTVMEACAALPLASSGIALGLGWLSLYGRQASLTSAALLHAVLALPFAFNSVMRGMEEIPRHVTDGAMLLGAGPLRTLATVTLPISLQRIRSAWGLAAALSLGEMNALMMLGRQDWETLPIFIYRAAGAYRYGAACAGGALLILACLAALLLADAGTQKD